MTQDYQFQIVCKDLTQFSKVYLIPLSDFHEGARDADRSVSDGYIKWIADHDNAFTFLNGDMLNCATKDSTPDLFEDLVTPDEAYRRLVKRLTPIKDKIFMITRGGHEEAIFRKVGADYMARLAYDLGDIPYRPDGGMFALWLSNNGRNTVFTGYATHGWGGARTIGAKVKKTEDLLSVADVDLYILSHDHTQHVHRINTFIPPLANFSLNKANYMTVRRKMLVGTGGFVKNSGYVRRKGYSPQDLGTPRIRLEIKLEQVRGSTRYYKDLHASL